MATFDVAKLLNKITQDIPGINTVLKALAKWDVSALTDVPDGAMQATTDTNNRLTIKKKVSDSYTPVAKLMHDVDMLDGYHASASATANAVAVRNAQGALPGNITGNAATAATAVALAAGSVVPLNQGGTEATTASQARANLGAAGSADFTAHIAKQASPTVEGHIKLDALAADGSNTAAPGGFGLGKSLSLATDYNNCVVNGWYYGSNSTANKPPTTANYHVFVQAINTSQVLQKAYRADGSDYYTRVCSSGVWSEWVQKPIGITDSTSTASSTIAASAAAVKTAFDRAKQIATTTSRGIGKVATLADMGPDAVIENGPAFLAAGSDVVTQYPRPNTIMRRDGAGRVRVEDPVHDKDVANKGYVDAVAQASDVPSVLPGTVLAFTGTFGGSDGKRPINSYTGQADEGWALCDGRTYRANSDTPKLPTPDLRNRFIMGASEAHEAGTYGGSLEHTHDVTVAPHTLTVEQIPSHTHLLQVFDVDESTTLQGLLSGTTGGGRVDLIASNKGKGGSLNVISPEGDSQAHSHGASSDAASSLPPYYALAYIMKL